MLSSNAYDLFLTLIDFRKLLVIHGLENCFALRLEIVFMGACLFTSMLNLLWKEENVLFVFLDWFEKRASQFTLERSAFNMLLEKRQKPPILDF